jgi:tripartite-type tricarboxylate transporter receptor subunit TctC
LPQFSPDTENLEMKPIERRDLLKLGLGGAVFATLPLAASAAVEGTVRLIVPFAPGGATDVVGRLWAERMRAVLGTVVVENRGGGGGEIGAQEVARAQPDGHSFLMGNTSTQVIIPAAMTPPPYDPLKDFSAIYVLCMAPNSIVVHESVPVHTLRELIAYAKANPGKLSYGSAGTGTITNLTGELFKQLIGAPDIVHIPYKGSAPGLIDLAAGRIPMMTPNIGAPLLALHRAGKVRILAITWTTRIKAAPDIPTAIEAGLPGMVAANLNGVFAPGGLQQQLAGRIADATRAAMQDESFTKPMIDSGFEPLFDSGPDAATQMVREEIARWTPVIKASGFRME